MRGCPFLANSETAGGRSWTKEWLKCHNSCFVDMAKADPECVAFPTDRVLVTDPGFRPHFELFAKDQAAFFAAYAESHRKLSELGSKFEPPADISGHHCLGAQLPEKNANTFTPGFSCTHHHCCYTHGAARSRPLHRLKVALSSAHM